MKLTQAPSPCPSRCRAVAWRSSPAFARPSPGAAPSSATCRPWRWPGTPRASCSTGPRSTAAGRRGHRRPGGAVGAHAQRGARGEPPAAVPPHHPGLHAQPRLRLGRPGHHQRRRPDRLGHADVVLAGGVESLSDIPILHSRGFSQLLVDASKAKTLGAAAAASSPRCARATSCPSRRPSPSPRPARSMGQSAEKMAKENGITPRGAGPRSRCRATSAPPPAPPTAGSPPRSCPGSAAAQCDEVVTSDNGIRSDTSLEQLAALQPVFDRALRHRHRRQRLAAHRRRRGRAAHGARSGARALGYEPLAFLRELRRRRGRSRLAAAAWGRCSRCRWRSSAPGSRWSDLDLVEMHEAFAAQVLSQRRRRGARSSGPSGSGCPAPVGEVDWERTNVMGGSIAIGHPFGATGARIVTTLANEMRAARRAVRPDLHLRAGRHGLRDGPGADLTMTAFTRRRSRRRHRRRHVRPPRRAGQHALHRRWRRSSTALLDRPRAATPSVRAVVLISGKPDTFIAGADIEEFTRAPHRRGRHGAEPSARRSCMNRVAASPQAGRRRDPRRLPRRRARARARLPLARRHRPPEDPARPPRGAARPHPRRRRLQPAAAR